MKAVVQDRYGTPRHLQVREVPRPTPGPGEVLVRVHAASVHPDVWHVVTGFPTLLRLSAGLRRPKNPIPGTDVAGRVEALGPGATRFAVGDAVFGETLRGNQWTNGGAYAEYVAVSEEALARKPEDVPFEVAAAVPTTGLIALSVLRHEAELRAGQSVLVNGAGGGVGSLVVQLAKARGATVTAVDGPEKQDWLRTLGADQVLDYTRDDFTQRPERHDLIVDVPGNHRLPACRRALAPGGVYVLVGHDGYGRTNRLWGSVPRALGLVALSRFRSYLPTPDFTPPRKDEAMDTLADLLATGQLTPRVARTFPLEGVSEALELLASGHTLGKLVITP